MPETCKKCGGKMVKVGTTENGIVLRCVKNSNHEYEKKFTPKQQLRIFSKELRRPPLNERKRAERFTRRRKQEQGSQ